MRSNLIISKKTFDRERKLYYAWHSEYPDSTKLFSVYKPQKSVITRSGQKAWQKSLESVATLRKVKLDDPFSNRFTKNLENGILFRVQKTQWPSIVRVQKTK